MVGGSGIIVDSRWSLPRRRGGTDTTWGAGPAKAKRFLALAVSQRASACIPHRAHDPAAACGMHAPLTRRRSAAVSPACAGRAARHASKMPALPAACGATREVQDRESFCSVSAKASIATCSEWGRCRAGGGAGRIQESRRSARALRRWLLPRSRGETGHPHLYSQDAQVDAQKLPLIVVLVLVPNADGFAMAGGGHPYDVSALDLVAAPEESRRSLACLPRQARRCRRRTQPYASCGVVRIGKVGR